MSVAKPGYSSVVTSAATSFFAPRTTQRAWTGFADVDAGFAQLGDDRSQVFRRAAGEFEISVGDGSGHQKRAGFDAVGDDGVRRAVQLFFSAHANRGGSRAFDVRSHFDQQLREVRNFRFARRILDNGFALGEGRRHQNIFRSGDGNFVEENAAARQAASARRARFHVAVGHSDFGAHLFERFQMQVHRTRADRASAGKRNPRVAAARDERPEREDRSPHRFHEFVRRFGPVDLFRLNDHRRGRNRGRLDDRAQVREQASHRDDVAHARNVFEFYAVAGQQRGGHRGQRGIFAPLMRTEPSSGLPPSIRSLSMWVVRAACDCFGLVKCVVDMSVGIAQEAFGLPRACSCL